MTNHLFTAARGLPVGQRDGGRQSDEARGARPPDRDEAALLVAPHRALHGEEALQGPGDVEGARQPECAEQERGEHGQGDEPPGAWSPLRRRRRRRRSHGKP